MKYSISLEQRTVTSYTAFEKSRVSLKDTNLASLQSDCPSWQVLNNSHIPKRCLADSKVRYFYLSYLSYMHANLFKSLTKLLKHCDMFDPHIVHESQMGKCHPTES